MLPRGNPAGLPVLKVWVCLLAAIGACPSPAHAQNALSFFKNYFVTGDYAVAGVGLEGTGVSGAATGSIVVSGVPTDAEVLAAFLYWQVISDAGPDAGSQLAAFEGHAMIAPGSPGAAVGGPLAVVTSPDGAAPCWSSGGATGSSGGGKRTYTYRADVLRFLPVGPDGRHRVNGAHSVRLPDAGNSASTPRALGASLVVIYRDPDPSTPLHAIVMYDGSYSMDNSTGGMTQAIEGFYDAAPGPGRITHIAGSAQANKSERLVVPGGAYVNLFRAGQGPSWDNVTVPTAAVSGDALTTSVGPDGGGSFDCLTWGALIYRTAVNDTDGDGLLDRWETSGSASLLFDPTGAPLPPLGEMGASPLRKDLFIEVGYMQTGDAGALYGGAAKPAHTHAPTHEAIRLFGEAFQSAPVVNPDGSRGITVHLDLGEGYATGRGDPYVLRGPHARGGESIDETATVCQRGAEDPPWVCQFAGFPGTVGWKSGFRFLRDQFVGSQGEPLDATAETACETDGGCRQRFDRTRKDMFRYVLFAHALGVPKEPCLTDGFPDLACSDTNPLFHVPATHTGVGDFPGGDALVTLGAFSDAAGRPVGTDYMQAATLMHELGHVLALRHGGAPTEPNCKPNYQSIMNYLFQLRGLMDDQGRPRLDFSGQRLGGLDEASLNDPGGLGMDLDTLISPPYRTGYYAPPGPGTFGSPATRHCDGSPLAEGESPMVRVDTTSIDGTRYAIDWNALPEPPSPDGQDVNFDGIVGPLNPGTNDWAVIRLNQLGSRRNVGGWYWVRDAATGSDVAFMGPMSLDVGRGDLGRGDLGRGDLGRGDLGRGDLGRGDLGRGDLGRGDLGRGDLGRGDLGRGDLGRGDLGRGDLGRGDLGDSAAGDGEMTSELISASGYSPPNEFMATIAGIDDGCAGLPAAACHRIHLAWTGSNSGPAVSFTLYRSQGGTVTSLGQVTGETFSAVDDEELPNGEFTYFATATFSDGKVSGPSNFATITAVNVAPVAGDEAYTTGSGVPLVVAAAGVLENDTDIDSPSLRAEVVGGPAHGAATLNADGSFTYVPAIGYAGTDSFSYMARDVDSSRGSNVATVAITVEDATPPVVLLNVPSITPGTGGNGFFRVVVTLTVSATDPSTVVSIACTDNGAPVAVGGLSGIGTALAAGSLTLGSDGTHNVECRAADGAGNAGAADGSANAATLRIDRTAPSIVLTAPVADAAYLLNASVAASFACSDGGSGVDACSGTVSNGSSLVTDPVGPRAFEVTAADRAGNVAAASVTYYVRYAVAIAPPKSSRLGSAIPLGWELRDARGVALLQLNTLVTLKTVYNGPRPRGGVCAVSMAGPVVQQYNPATGATGGSDFRLSTSGYRFNWDTTTVKATGRGCYTIVWQFNDNAGPPPGYDVLAPSLLSAAAVEVQ